MAKKHIRHTQGPWTIERCDGYLINGVIHIPNVYEEHHADAYLMLASPDMLTTLQDTLDWMVRNDYGGSFIANQIANTIVKTRVK